LPEWLIERGIGETRFALVENGEIIEARVLLDGVLPAGTALRAQLKQTSRPTIAASGERQFVLPGGAAGLTEGMVLTIEITRESIPGAEPWKRPLARMIEGDCRSAALPEGNTLPFPSGDDRLATAGWQDVLDEARIGIFAFPGGELRISPTPAMTLIDVDGQLPPAKLAVAGAKAAARAIRRHGIGGSIGIDLPTVGSKEIRQAAAAAIDDMLPRPFERTSVNGFGFLQIVRPRTRASLFELAADQAGFEARALLRQAGREVGAIRLAAHPAVVAVIESHPDWIQKLSQQVGGAVTLRSDPALAMSGGHAERP